MADQYGEPQMRHLPNLHLEPLSRFFALNFQMGFGAMTFLITAIIIPFMSATIYGWILGQKQHLFKKFSPVVAVLVFVADVCGRLVVGYNLRPNFLQWLESGSLIFQIALIHSVTIVCTLFEYTASKAIEPSNETPVEVDVLYAILFAFFIGFMDAVSYTIADSMMGYVLQGRYGENECAVWKIIQSCAVAVVLVSYYDTGFYNQMAIVLATGVVGSASIVSITRPRSQQQEQHDPDMEYYQLHPLQERQQSQESSEADQQRPGRRRRRRRR